jgi:pyrroline-5-carboxylate reductase
MTKRRSRPTTSRTAAPRRAAAAATLGFVGGGNMAGALLRGLLAAGTYARRDILVAEPVPERRRTIARTFRVGVTADNRAVISKSATVVLAVKPQVMDAVLAEIRPTGDPRPLFISIAAGVRLARLEEALGAGARVVRVMPNTPALLGKGMSVLVAGRHARARDVSRTLAIFRAVGQAVAVKREALMDAVTGLSGSGPAFVYAFTEALIDGGRRAGLRPDLAARLALETVAGAAAMLTETGKSPAALREMVSSPGGTTVAGLAHLEAAGFGKAVQGAVTSAAARSRELARG